jgi:hypothetical protein
MALRSARSKNWESDPESFPAPAYSARGYAGIAFRIGGWETEPDDDTEWSGFEVRTGRVIAIMVGDDRPHSFDPSDLTPIDRASYCGECGQIGCAHDGLDRSED